MNTDEHGWKKELRSLFPRFYGCPSVPHLWLILFVFVFSGCASRATPPTTRPTEPFPSATPRAVVDVCDKIFPAVVRLDVAQEIYAEGKRNLRRGIGSGVIIETSNPLA